ncbi:MAG: hypothetical protein KatS3mg051_1088 [Anaerolineae bacterium]|nr:MAG: hypothetical protein KatS3mg051_1088 [Anaerolineae bacterium]
MGSLSVSVGQFSSTFEFADVRGGRLIQEYVEAHGGPVMAPNQEQLDWFLSHLARRVREEAISYRRHIAIETAVRQVEREAENW